MKRLLVNLIFLTFNFSLACGAEGQQIVEQRQVTIVSPQTSPVMRSEKIALNEVPLLQLDDKKATDHVTSPPVKEDKDKPAALPRIGSMAITPHYECPTSPPKRDKIVSVPSLTALAAYGSFRGMDDMTREDSRTF